MAPPARLRLHEVVIRLAPDLWANFCAAAINLRNSEAAAIAKRDSGAVWRWFEQRPMLRSDEFTPLYYWDHVYQIRRSAAKGNLIASHIGQLLSDMLHFIAGYGIAGALTATYRDENGNERRVSAAEWHALYAEPILRDADSLEPWPKVVHKFVAYEILEMVAHEKTSALPMGEITAPATAEMKAPAMGDMIPQPTAETTAPAAGARPVRKAVRAMMAKYDELVAVDPDFGSKSGVAQHRAVLRGLNIPIGREALPSGYSYDTYLRAVRKCRRDGELLRRHRPREESESLT